MNDNRQMEVHYVNTGCPYTMTESFMDFFEGLNHVPANYTQGLPTHDQENLYWPMNANAYKYEYPVAVAGGAYYAPYEVNSHLPRMDLNRRVWEYPSILEAEELPSLETQSVGNVSTGVHPSPEECSPDHLDASSTQVTWQDNVDPDNMTYEELLDLGETVGTQSRGLSQEHISLLPTSRFKATSLFSRKRSRERCVVCQTRYKIGNKQTKLPCKHVYHTDCITKWLSINKICPVCNIEVFGEESLH